MGILTLQPARCLRARRVVFPSDPIVFGPPVQKRMLRRRHHAWEYIPDLPLSYMTTGSFRMGNAFSAPIPRSPRIFHPRALRIMLRMNNVINAPARISGDGECPSRKDGFPVSSLLYIWMLVLNQTDRLIRHITHSHHAAPLRSLPRFTTPGGREQAAGAIASSEEGSSRRNSDGSLSTATRRVATSSAKTPMGPDASRQTSPHRPKAYHFYDGPPPAQGPDLGSAIRSLARHGPPVRLHTAQSQIPSPDETWRGGLIPSFLLANRRRFPSDMWCKAMQPHLPRRTNRETPTP